MLRASLIAAFLFVAMAPTLSWLEFSSGLENLNIATAMEIRRTGHWLIPTLELEPRLAKPPLPAWITAMAIRESTLAKLDSADATIRDRAYRDLAFQTRWPGLLASCLTIVAVFALGRTIAGESCGLIAAAMYGSTLFFLRFGRQSTTDVHLALWVCVALAAIARCIFDRATVRRCCVAGAALALAMMSKGPVCLLQTIVPAALMLVFLRWRGARFRSLLPILGGVLVFLCVGTAWYAVVYLRVPSAMELWRKEWNNLSRDGAPGSPFDFASLLPYLMPWTLFLLHGLLWSAIELMRRVRNHRPATSLDEEDRSIFIWVALIAPLLIMSFMPNRAERYLLPLAAPACILAARSLRALFSSSHRDDSAPLQTYILILLVAVTCAACAALRTVHGNPWTSPWLAAPIGIIAVIGILAVHRTAPGHIAATLTMTVAIMLLIHAMVLSGYRNSREGRSEMRPLAEVIRERFPDALIYNWRPAGDRKRAPVDLSIYLNRVTTWTANPATLSPDPRPQIYVVVQNASTQVSGWQFFARIPRDKDWYCAFIREVR